MRVRSVNTGSLLVILVCFGLVVAVAPLREGVVGALGAAEESPDLFALAEQRGDDANAWVAALAQTYGTTMVTEEQQERAYLRATELLGRSPAPHFLYAGRMMYLLPLAREEINALGPPDLPENSRIRARALAPAHIARIAKARAALERAGELDPGNAAVDYLLAALTLGEHKDEEAMGILAGALRKPGWSLYQKEAAKATYALSPEAAMGLVSRSNLSLVQFARVLTGMAVMAERKADHQRAVFLREGAMRLGQQMLRQGFDQIDGLYGVIAWHVATAPPNPTDDAGADRQRLARYLRDHGRPELAEDMLSFSEKADGFAYRVPSVRHHELLERVSGALQGLVVWTVSVLIALLLFALLGLALTVGRREVRPVGIPWWASALLLLAWLPLLFASVVVGHPTGLGSVAVGLAAALLVALLAVVIRRSRDAEARRAGAAAQYVGTVTSLLLVVAAALSILALATSAYQASQIRVDRQMVERGEIESYGLRVQ